MEEKNIWTESQELFKEKQNQEFIYLNKVNPVNRQILKRLITEFDLSNPWFKILKKYNTEGEKVLEELKKSFLLREVFLNQNVAIINEAETKFYESSDNKVVQSFVFDTVFENLLSQK